MAEETELHSAGGCLLRLGWTLAGPLLLFVTGALLVEKSPPWGSWPDYVFIGLAAVVALCRLLDRKAADGSGVSRGTYVALVAAAVGLVLGLAHFKGFPG